MALPDQRGEMGRVGGETPDKSIGTVVDFARWSFCCWDKKARNHAWDIRHLFRAWWHRRIYSDSFRKDLLWWRTWRKGNLREVVWWGQKGWR